MLGGEYSTGQLRITVSWLIWLAARQIVTGELPFNQLHTTATIIKHTADGTLPAIQEDRQLSHVLMLCSLMSDCWISQPARRIDASTFQRKVGLLVSTLKKDDASDSEMDPP